MNELVSLIFIKILGVLLCGLLMYMTHFEIAPLIAVITLLYIIMKIPLTTFEVAMKANKDLLDLKWKLEHQ